LSKTLLLAPGDNVIPINMRVVKMGTVVVVVVVVVVDVVVVDVVVVVFDVVVVVVDVVVVVVVHLEQEQALPPSKTSWFSPSSQQDCVCKL